MSESETYELGPNDQETFTVEVEDDEISSLLIPMKSSEHKEVSTFPTWILDGEEFPEGEKGISAYPAELSVLGDVLKIKIRNNSEKPTKVTVGTRKKKAV